MILRLTLLSVLVFLLFPQDVSSQYVTKKVKSKHQIYTDSLKQVKYDYIFPILGQGAYSKGFDIPYPIGIMANYMTMNQGIVFDNFSLGFKSEDHDIPLTEVDFIEFGESRNKSYSVNFRPDVWIFPFLSVYGIFGFGRSRTEVNLTAPVPLKSNVDQTLTTSGFGLLTAFGVGPVWVSVDANWTWNKPELLDKAVRVNVLGVRMGHTFVFKQKPERNIAVWLGGMRAKMNSATSGEIALIDALPPEVWEGKDDLVSEYWDWYDNLGPTDIAKKKIADEVLTPIVDAIDDANGESIIRYAMDKQVAELWNGVVGMQFQVNKSWMFRTEAGVFGDRKSFIFSANYRFLL